MNHGDIDHGFARRGVSFVIFAVSAITSQTGEEAFHDLTLGQHHESLDPRWAKNGRELFFAKGGFGTPRSFWSTQVQPGPTFVAGKPSEIAKSASTAAVSVAYDVAPDGRFLVHVDASSGAAAAASRPQLVVVQHWFDELKARVPTTPRQD